MVRVRAPELPLDNPWLNTDQPLSIRKLKGQVVLLDFWSYCCINCLHVLPDLKYLEQKYKGNLIVIGIHSGKFTHEKETASIRQAVLRYEIAHPVLVDSDFEVWQQYAVRAWPTLVVIDPEGYVLGHVSGEGHRETLDKLIDQVIREHQAKSTLRFQELSLMLEQRRSLDTPLAFPGKVLAGELSSGEPRLFIADSGHHRLVISDLDGKVLQVIGTGSAGFRDGSFAEAQFFAPQGMALDVEQQTLYVADTHNHAVRKIDLQRQTVEAIAGTGQQSYYIWPHGGSGLTTALNSPWDLAKVGHYLFIAMAGLHQIWQMDLRTGYVQTYAGSGAEACVDGPRTVAAFAQPSGITADGQTLYVADSETSSIRKIISDRDASHGAVQTLCGSGELFDFGDIDGVGEAVRLQHCLGVEAAQGFVWVADTYNHKIKRIDPSTGICQTVLGNGAPGHTEAQGIQAQFSEPSGLSIYGRYLYVADTNNHAIRRIDLETMAATSLQFSELCSPNVCTPTSFKTTPMD